MKILVWLIIFCVVTVVGVSSVAAYIFKRIYEDLTSPSKCLARNNKKLYRALKKYYRSGKKGGEKK